MKDKLNEYIVKNNKAIKQSIILVIIEDDIGKEGRYEINKWVEAKILGEKALSEKDYYINKIIYMGFLTQYLDK